MPAPASLACLTRFAMAVTLASALTAQTTGRTITQLAPANLGVTAQYVASYPSSAAGNLGWYVMAGHQVGTVPVPIPGFTINGSCLVNPAVLFQTFLFFMDGSGSSALSLAVPNSFSLLGFPFDLQTLDANLATSALSWGDNDVEVVVGPGAQGPLPSANMVFIPAGTFAMGSTAGSANEQPVHQVTISRPFWIGKYEVTQAEYQALMGSNPSRCQGASYPESHNRPVESVYWHDAVTYCSLRTSTERAAGRLPAGYEYRLPTEAEWEYCCRAGTTTEWNTGPSLSVTQATIRSNIITPPATTTVGSYTANAFGLYDMHGNVREWCLDSWDGSNNYPASAVIDPYVRSGTQRVSRGGNWTSSSYYARSAYRLGVDFDRAGYYQGFRVVLAPTFGSVATPHPNFIAIPAGEFAMGSNAGAANEQPVHRVMVSRPFWMGKYEVSQSEYQSIVGSNPSFHQGASFPSSGNLPVEQVSYAQAMNYCSLLTANELAAGRMPVGWVYRLPTEAEWEYACRAGATTEFSMGTTLSCPVANYSTCVGQTSAVGSYAANAFGLHDMHGNVAEWCLDSWDGSANYASAALIDPLVTAGSARIVRGGALGFQTNECRSAARSGLAPGTTSVSCGFRVVLSPSFGRENVPLPNFVAIPAGTFSMGSAPNTGGAGVEMPAHQVTISQSFWMCKYEVTQADYGGIHWGLQGPNLPVRNKLWSDAMSYCVALSDSERTAGRLAPGYEYRLPTEAEWEYCCRAGTTTGWSTGSTLSTSQANFNQAIGEITNVGSYAANAFGLFDMHGNVAEYCLDAWDMSNNYPASAVIDPYVRNGDYRAVRGGGYPSDSFHCRSATRIVGYLSGTDSAVGFRVVLARIPQTSAVTVPLPNFVAIPAGTFQMGSTFGPANAQPVHPVTITQPFWMGKYEVTQSEYQAVMGSNPSYHPGATRPVEQVSWDNAMAYCAALTTTERAAGRIPVGYQYRLPTEAEWEYCCRAGTTTEWNTGWTISSAEANVSFSNLGTVPVGSYAANAFGLFDMHGNVCEWCLDWWDGSSNYPSAAVTDPYVNSGALRIRRGGGWCYTEYDAKSAFRDLATYPAMRATFSGFRVVCAPVLP